MNRERSATIFSRICIPLFVIMLLQSLIFYFVTGHGRIINTLNSNAVDILSERVDNRRNELESKFSSQWTNMALYNNSLNDLYQKNVALYSETPLYSDASLQKKFLSDASTILFSMIRNNEVNGVFLILNDTNTLPYVSQESGNYYGLCIRDYDLTSGYTDKEDLQIERCPSSLASSMGCSLGSYWDAFYTFDNQSYSGDFFFNPLKAAYDNPGVSNDNLAYFSSPHTYGNGDQPVVSYSLPLIASDGTVYGVLGIELTTTYLASLLPVNELQDQNNGAYMLVQYEEKSSDFHIVSASGTLSKRCFSDTTDFTLDTSQTLEGRNNLYTYTGMQKLNVACYISPLTIYNRNTPFDNEVFALAGIVQRDALFSVSHNVRSSLFFVTILALGIGLLGIFIVSHLLSRPIKSLGNAVQSMGPMEDTRLAHINIREIDQLVDAIENQSRTINQSRVRTEFFSRMSHDMRTPMNAIIGFSSPELLENSNKEQLLEYLEKINGSGKYLLGLINEVLDMTKIDSGRMELDNRPFCTNGLWNDILPMIDELAERKGVHFIREIPLSHPYTVSGDVQRLSQVFVNLLSNAIKFTGKGGTVTLKVNETLSDAEHLSYVISISDTGIGMSPEFIAKMYQPFSQEHPNREGTGLGLSIAQQLITLMGGSIRCDSALGQGTTFTVLLTLPLANAVIQSAEASPEYSAERLMEILSDKRILLCEDHPLNRQIALRLLNKMNISVTTAENGKLGVDLFETSETGYFDAVLMDIRMPVMNGLEAAKAIRKLSRVDAKSIPIIAMTANAFKEDIDASASAGMNEHLAKPIEPQKLYQTLAHYLDLKG